MVRKKPSVLPSRSPPGSLTWGYQSMGRHRDGILVFTVAGQRQGIPLERVQELLPMVALIPVPDAPSLEGVFNLRGTAVPVVNLRRALHLPDRAAEPWDHLIVCRTGNQPVALRVDRALDLIILDAGAESLMMGSRARIAIAADELVLLPDLDALLAAASAITQPPRYAVPQASEEQP